MTFIEGIADINEYVVMIGASSEMISSQCYQFAHFINLGEKRVKSVTDRCNSTYI